MPLYGGAGGGGGTPGGSTLQLQYNSAGAFAGMAGTEWDDTNRSLTITGTTITANKPIFELSQTWNNAGVTFAALRANITDTASNAASKLLDLQVGGISKLSVTKSGQILGKAGYDDSAPSYSFTGYPTTGMHGTDTTLAFTLGGSLRAYFGGVGLVCPVGGFGISLSGAGAFISFSAGGGSNALLTLDAIDKWALRRSASAQDLRVYNTWTDASNGEWSETAWASNVCYLRNNKNGSGAARLLIPVTGSATVAGLPSASTAGAGARAFVTDATATTFLSTVAGGGGNAVPVVSNGTNWLIG